MVDASKFNYDEMLNDEEKAKAKVSQADLFARISTEPQISPDSLLLQAVQPSATEIRLIEIDRKLNAIMDHLNIPR